MNPSDSMREETPLSLDPGPDRVLSGLHDIEADLPDQGLWVERKLQFLLPRAFGGRLSMEGLFFPKLIPAQNGETATRLRFFIGKQEVHSTSLQRHGPFRVTFDVPHASPTHSTYLVVVSDRSFVPAEISSSNDQRELCWRLQFLRIGELRLFDCKRVFNFFIGEPEDVQNITHAGDPARRDTTEVRFHLDAPRTGIDADHRGAFAVSGWAFDRSRRRALTVRVVVGNEALKTHTADRPDVAKAFGLESTLPATGFSVLVSPRDGLLRFAIELLHPAGLWITCQRGWVIAATSLAERPEEGSVERLTRALPVALRSRIQDRLRSARISMPSARLAKSCHFHLDAPKTEGLNIVRTDCLISGWVFDEEAATPMPVRIRVGDKEFPADSRQREDVQRAFKHVASMPLHTGFARVLDLPLGIHHVRVEVRRPDGVWVQMRRSRILRLPSLFGKDAKASQLSFRAYRKLEENYRKRELPEVRRHIEVMLRKPRFSVIVGGTAAREIQTSVRSVQQQVYAHFTIHVLASAASDDSAIRALGAARHEGPSLPAADDEFVVFLRGSQTLSPFALYRFASAINAFPDLDLIYADETTAPTSGREPTPFYKPDWSPDYLETFNYVGATACFRAGVAAPCIDDVQSINPYDLVLRVTEASPRILHIPAILGHDASRRDDGSAVDPGHSVRDIAALAARLGRTGRRGAVTEHAAHMGCYEISLELRRSPLVSVIIPTAGKTIILNERRIDLIVNVVGQIQRGSYENIEIIIVDNGDLSPAQVEFLDGAGCRRVTYREPLFNISKKLNLGADLALGEFLLLMNDDIEVLHPDWIGRMVQHFEKPHVGVVGAKLLYPDGKLQHVGVVHNTGNPDHVRRLFERNDPGYFFSTCGVRNYGAVTGACMMTPARVYRAVGGYTEDLAVSYNDADFCLKVRSEGLSVVYAGSVELVHMESQSRIASADWNEVLWYQIRWAPDIISDPFYNERFLTVAPPTFVPRVNERLV